MRNLPIKTTSNLLFPNTRTPGMPKQTRLAVFSMLCSQLAVPALPPTSAAGPHPALAFLCVHMGIMVCYEAEVAPPANQKTKKRSFLSQTEQAM